MLHNSIKYEMYIQKLEYDMELKTAYGVGKILFGMKPKDVENELGKPSQTFKDDDGNQIYVYNDLRLRLEFYDDEENRLALIATSSPLSTVNSKTVINETFAEVKLLFDPKGNCAWEVEIEDITTRHFCEDNWTTVDVEFGKISKIEIGALIKNDEFQWKFK